MPPSLHLEANVNHPNVCTGTLQTQYNTWLFKFKAYAQTEGIPVREWGNNAIHFIGGNLAEMYTRRCRELGIQFMSWSQLDVFITGRITYLNQNRSVLQVRVQRFDLIKECANHRPAFPVESQMVNTLEYFDNLFAEAQDTTDPTQASEAKQGILIAGLPPSIQRPLMMDLTREFRNEKPYTYSDVVQLLKVYRMEFDNLVMIAKSGTTTSPVTRLSLIHI